MQAKSNLAYGVNQPVSVNSGYRILERSDGDMVALSTLAFTYTVVSRVPAATERQLNAAEGDYPADISERYLQLPTIPDRVRELAEEVVRQSGAVTRYEKARAIEQYLRTIPYDLTIKAPPAGQDVADYFLFTAKRGYCDYSATAAVVMLRAVGVAARYCSGYNMGNFNFQEHAYVVTDNNAHAWVEVYFPGYGWIEFEPTPSQVVFERAAGAEQSLQLPTVGPITLPEQGTSIRIPFWSLAVLLVLIVLFIIVWPPRWFRGREQSPQERVLRVYEDLLGAVRWLNLAPAGGQTPHEFLDSCSQDLESRAGFAQGMGRDLSMIDHAYYQMRYGTEPLPLGEGDYGGERLAPHQGQAMATGICLAAASP